MLENKIPGENSDPTAASSRAVVESEQQTDLRRLYHKLDLLLEERAGSKRSTGKPRGRFSRPKENSYSDSSSDSGHSEASIARLEHKMDLLLAEHRPTTPRSGLGIQQGSNPHSKMEIQLNGITTEIQQIRATSVAQLDDKTNLMLIEKTITDADNVSYRRLTIAAVTANELTNSPRGLNHISDADRKLSASAPATPRRDMGSYAANELSASPYATPRRDMGSYAANELSAYPYATPRRKSGADPDIIAAAINATTTDETAPPNAGGAEEHEPGRLICICPLFNFFFKKPV